MVKVEADRGRAPRSRSRFLDLPEVEVIEVDQVTPLAPLAPLAATRVSPWSRSSSTKVEPSGKDVLADRSCDRDRENGASVHLFEGRKVLKNQGKRMSNRGRNCGLELENY